MSDQSETKVTEAAVDPVAEARKIMAGQATAPDEVQGLKRQVRALWIVMGITLFLVVIMSIFTLLPRFFGVRIGAGFGGRGNFQPGQGQQFQQNPGQNQQAPTAPTP